MCERVACERPRPRTEYLFVPSPMRTWWCAATGGPALDSGWCRRMQAEIEASEFGAWKREHCSEWEKFSLEVGGEPTWRCSSGLCGFMNETCPRVLLYEEEASEWRKWVKEKWGGEVVLMRAEDCKKRELRRRR